MKKQIKDLFTAFPSCIVTYIVIAAVIGLFACNWKDVFK